MRHRERYGGTMRKTLLEYCIQHDRQDLLEQWYTEKNGGITPADISFGSSSRKFWWRCRNGHEWETTVSARTTSQGNCPYCSGRRLAQGDDLAAKYPVLACQWHLEKNGDLRPDQVAPGTHKRVWWRCEKGHEWQAEVKSRVSGTGCPVCANRKVEVGVNDLASLYPKLAQEWHSVKNGTLTPKDISCGSRRKAWWICQKGHEWQASIASRVYGSDCPVCANKTIVSGENDLASGNPRLASEWLQEKNEGLRPDQVSMFSNRRVWWQCRLGHQWRAVIAHRNKNGSGCPVCAGKMVWKGFNDLQSQRPDIAREWHPTLNGKLSPEDIYVGSSQQCWWQCAHGHVWKTMVNVRTRENGSGCPACAGKINQAKQRYYEQIERESQVRRIMADDVLPEDIWEWQYSGESLAGRTFARWTVQNDVIRDAKNRRKWRCRCECGTEKYVFEKSLLRGRSQSCGCLARERLREKLTYDLTGRSFADLQVIGRADTPKGKRGVYWTCQCSCGNEIDVLAANLTSGKRTSCGCKRPSGEGTVRL